VLVRLNSGLGNQLFEWAFGRCVAAARNEELFFEKYNLDAPGHRAYSLGAYDIDLSFKEPNGAPQFIETHEKFGFDPEVYKVPNGTHFIGNWQTEKYFDERTVRDELKLRNPVSAQTEAIAKEIQNEPQSAFVHVRRTDYLIPSTIEYHGIMPFYWYAEAIAYIEDRVPNVRFFVFSDDPEFCKEAFSKCRVVDHNKPGSGATGPGQEHEDLYLMSLCRHAIIPNSSFGWWAAWLGDENKKDRIVIAPKVWFRKEGLRFDDVVPNRWVKL
jgi:hypothetical protein